MNDEKHIGVLGLSRQLLTKLGMDRLVLQHLRRQEEDRKITRPAAQQASNRSTAPRCERRRTGITARQQRLRGQRVQHRDAIDARRCKRILDTWLPKNHADRRFLAVYGKAEAAR